MVQSLITPYGYYGYYGYSIFYLLHKSSTIFYYTLWLFRETIFLFNSMILFFI